MKYLLIILLIFPVLSWGQRTLGDANCDGNINVGDAVFLINYIFKGGPAPSCPNEIPTLTTEDVTSVTQTTAQCGGTITSDGKATVTARGVCWGTNLTPTVADSKTTDGAGAGSFLSFIAGLTADTPYYIRAYATNSAGTGYGMTMAFITNPLLLPVVATTTISAITQTTAQCGGNIESDGGAPVTARGVCWSTSPTPTTADNKTIDGTGTGSFTSSVSGLTGGTRYYIRAYATNIIGIGYGNIQSFVTTTVTDIDGNVYQTVLIGTQVWMAENLRVTHYRNGDAIPNVTDGTTWMGLTMGAYCEYNNDVNNVATYGRLYNWDAVTDSRNIAPAGWHMPSDAEWQILVDYLGGNSVAGGKLKDDTSSWQYPNVGATNESGFSGLPGGYRGDEGNYYWMGSIGSFWTSTETDASHAWLRYLGYDHSSVLRYSSLKRRGESVRCVKD